MEDSFAIQKIARLLIIFRKRLQTVNRPHSETDGVRELSHRAAQQGRGYHHCLSRALTTLGSLDKNDISGRSCLNISARVFWLQLHPKHNYATALATGRTARNAIQPRNYAS